MSFKNNEKSAIIVDNVSKCYQIFKKPEDRLKQIVLPTIRKAFGGKLKKYYDEYWAVKDVSFEVKKGETVGIIGRNGSGKSTLLQLICGVLESSQGNIQLNGRVAALLELGSGFNPEYTGKENVILNATILGLSKKQIDERYEKIVEFAEIGHFIDQPVKTYSSGMIVRLAFAVVAHVDADVLIVDEALSVGDTLFNQKCMRFLRKFIEDGTVLFVSHDISAVTSFCQRAILMVEGSIEAIGETKQVVDRYLELNYAANQEIKSSKIKDDEDYNTTKSPELNTRYMRDMRQDFINSSPLRNDIEVYKFNDFSSNFGTGGAELSEIAFTDINGENYSHVVGGEKVQLLIKFIAREIIPLPIIGFTFKDRLGQTIFADNTYLSHSGKIKKLNPGDGITAKFTFVMPTLPSGDYSISPAIATGTQEQHTQLKWVHDALVLRVEATSLSLGIIGWPMQDICVDYERGT